MTIEDLGMRPPVACVVDYWVRLSFRSSQQWLPASLNPLGCVAVSIKGHIAAPEKWQ